MTTTLIITTLKDIQLLHEKTMEQEICVLKLKFQLIR